MLNTQFMAADWVAYTVVVSNLDEAIANFESLGFLVQRGGTTGPVHNALIFFQDGQ